jgi:hypothetical protein
VEEHKDNLQIQKRRNYVLQTLQVPVVLKIASLNSERRRDEGCILHGFDILADIIQLEGKTFPDHRSQKRGRGRGRMNGMAESTIKIGKLNFFKTDLDIKVT